MGNVKHGKSWNYRSSLSRPGKSWNFEKCGSWEAMENKVIWAVLHLQTKETGKSCTQSRNFSKKNGQI